VESGLQVADLLGLDAAALGFGVELQGAGTEALVLLGEEGGEVLAGGARENLDAPGPEEETGGLEAHRRLRRCQHASSTRAVTREAR
jgi:hypothetical protein